MRKLTLVDLEWLNEREDNVLLHSMIACWKNNHADMAIDVLAHNYYKIKGNKRIVAFFEQFQETSNIH